MVIRYSIVQEDKETEQDKNFQNTFKQDLSEFINRAILHWFVVLVVFVRLNNVARNKATVTKNSFPKDKTNAYSFSLDNVYICRYHNTFLSIKNSFDSSLYLSTRLVMKPVSLWLNFVLIEWLLYGLLLRPSAFLWDFSVESCLQHLMLALQAAPAVFSLYLCKRRASVAVVVSRRYFYWCQQFYLISPWHDGASYQGSSFLCFSIVRAAAAAVNTLVVLL